MIDRLEVGGAERVFLDLTYLLLNENVPVDTLLISGKGPLYSSIDARAGKYFLDRKWKFNPFNMWKCASICSRYQIVHVHMRHTHSYVRLAQMISFKKFKIVFHDHFGDTEMDAQSLLTLKGLFKPRYYIGVSRKLVNWALSMLKVDHHNAFLLENTVIPSTENTQINTKQDMLMISNIRQIKNVELAIEVANQTGRKLTIYGNVYPSAYSEAILKLIETSSFVTLVEGETNIQRFFGNYSLALHTAHSETGPLVLMEYLARGLPFLAHTRGEVADVLKNELPECFIDSLDVTRWEEKIKHLEKAAPSSEKLRGLFNKYFSTQRYVEKCLNIYHKVLA